MRRVYYYLKNLLFRKHHLIRTGLSKGQWYDTDTRMLYGMMNLIVEYIEKEKPFDIIDWDADPDHQRVKEEILAIRDWWLDRPRRLAEIEKALDIWHDERFKGKDNWLETLNEPTTPKIEKLWKKLNKLERKLEREETLMLVRLVKIRRYLWT